MRLWHQYMIRFLDRQRLLAQHRECCALRGKGWGMNHSTVNYVFKYDRAHLFQYHLEVISEMERRGYNVAQNWKSPTYCGIGLPEKPELWEEYNKFLETFDRTCYIYPEHTVKQYMSDLMNLRDKGVDITIYPGGDLLV